MKNVLRLIASVALAGAVMVGLLAVQGIAWAQGESRLMVSDGEHKIHILPTVSQAAEFASLPADTGPLLYHSGGKVMTGSITFYAIYWIPAHLQNGGGTTLSSHYKGVENSLLTLYPAHGIDNNNTQYYQTVSGTTTYIQNAGSFGGYYTDTTAYPASGCNDSYTPGNCITDAQIQTEVKKVMSLKGWTGGLNKMFLLFTSSGEGSCFNSTGTSCAYTEYCAYHGAIAGSTPIVYANEPFGDLNACQEPGTPSPNNDPEADAAATSASHEMTEAITDPQLNAWYTALGNEIGDLCAYNYGSNTWDSSKANQKWNANYFEIQTEWDNHKSGCVQVGP